MKFVNNSTSSYYQILSITSFLLFCFKIQLSLSDMNYTTCYNVFANVFFFFDNQTMTIKSRIKKIKNCKRQELKKVKNDQTC